MIQKVVGISFKPTNNPNIEVGAIVQLVHDKDNKYSGRAIAVMFEDQPLGFIGEKGNELHEAIFDRLPLEATVSTLARLQPGEKFSSFKEGEITHLEISFPMEGDNDGKLPSFNEEGVYINFDRAVHRYVYNGQELVGATTYIKRWIAEFDSSMMSAVCAKKYGCKASEVVAFWEGGGEVANEFGTAIHDALEHYEKFRWLGEIVQVQKDLPFNKALPSHPLLRKIVEDFYRLDLQEGEVCSEVLLTNVERGICGQADRLLITGEKRCRVQDFKVNIEADKVDPNIKFLGQMAKLPKTKLSKYQLQMSCYAALLRLSGWEVEGLDAFVFEDSWAHYPLKVLSLDFGS